MPKIVLSQIVEAIDEYFGPSRQELDEQAVSHAKRVEVQARFSRYLVRSRRS
jgi:hypothetical protein